jgi:hypothetical protein
LSGDALSPIASGDYILIGSEQMLVTAVSGLTLTVQRGALSTTAASSYSSGADVYLGTDQRGAIRSSTTDSDVAPDVGAYQTETFGVYKAAATPNGIQLVFDEPVNEASTVLYTSPGDTTLGSANVTITGPNGAVRGSLVIDPTNADIANFVQTSGLLTAGTYVVTVTPAVTAVDGDVAPISSVETVTVTATTTPVLSVPSFARGPGQSVALSDGLGNTTGIPINISNVTGLTSATFTLTYDPVLLTIPATGALTLSTAATTAGLTSSYTITYVDEYHSVLTVTLSGGTGLMVGSTSAPLVTISASVPTTAPYLDKTFLNLSNVVVNGSAATGVSGVSVVAYLGDVLGTGIPNATDASLVDQVGSGAGTGFSKFKDLDPVIIAGIVVNDFSVNATDASLIAEAASGASVGIPAIPVGVTLVTGGADPYLYLSSVQGAAGQTVTETLYLDVTDPNGIQLTALDEAIGFDAGAVQVSDVRAASGLMGLGSYGTWNTVDNTSGQFLVAQAFMGSGLPPVVPYGTVIPVLQFDVTLNADMSVGSQTGITLLQYGTVNGMTQYTAVSDNEGALTFTPGKVPSNSGNAAVDGSVTVVPATVGNAGVVSTTQQSTAGKSGSVAVVKRVTPVRQPAAKTASTTVDLVTPLVSSGGANLVDEAVAAAAGIQPSTVVALSQPDTTIAMAMPNVSPLPAVETVQSPNLAGNATRSVDADASLSVAAVGTNRTAPVAATGTASNKASTNALDEVYRLMGTASGVAPTVGGDHELAGDSGMELSDMWDLEYILSDSTGDDPAN